MTSFSSGSGDAMGISADIDDGNFSFCSVIESGGADDAVRVNLDDAESVVKLLLSSFIFEGFELREKKTDGQ